MEAFLITFRESLEAAIIIGLLFSLLKTLKQEKYNKYITLGVLGGIIGSLIFAYIFKEYLGGFEGEIEKIYEGILMISACLLITHMIFWMKKHAKYLKKEMTEKIKKSISHKTALPIFFLAFFSVIREGVETVIFFQAIEVQSDYGISIIGGLMGVIIAIILAIFLHKFTDKISYQKFFKYSSLVLIFIAGGLLAHSIVEFQGANLLPTYIKPLFDTSEFLSEKHGFGSFLKALFGYDANPSLLAVISYVLFITISLTLFSHKKYGSHNNNPHS